MKTPEEIVSEMPNELRAKVYKKLYEAAMIINSVEVDIADTEFEGVLPRMQSNTVWCELFDLERLFKTII